MTVCEHAGTGAFDTECCQSSVKHVSKATRLVEQGLWLETLYGACRSHVALYMVCSAHVVLLQMQLG